MGNSDKLSPPACASMLDDFLALSRILTGFETSTPSLGGSISIGWPAHPLSRSCAKFWSAFAKLKHDALGPR